MPIIFMTYFNKHYKAFLKILHLNCFKTNLKFTYQYFLIINYGFFLAVEAAAMGRRRVGKRDHCKRLPQQMAAAHPDAKAARCP
jgi:hypothetical protein